MRTSADMSPAELERQKRIDDAESIAAHRAGEVYLETLCAELGKLGGVATVMGALGTTTHVHYALVDGEAKGVIRYTFQFHDSPAAVRAVIEAKAKRGIA